MLVRYGWMCGCITTQAVQTVGADVLIGRVLAAIPLEYQDGDPIQVTVGGYRFRGCVVCDALIIEKATPVHTRKKQNI